MEENKTSRPKSIIKIILVIFGMLAFGAAGFYFGSQDTFKVTKKKEKKEPVVEVQKEEKDTDITEDINVDLTEEEKLTYSKLVSTVSARRIGGSIVYGGVDTTIMKDGETFSVTNLTKDSILDIAFKNASISGLVKEIDTGEDEETYYETAYSSKYEYHITLNDLNKSAKSILNVDAIDNFPDTYNYGLRVYKLEGNEYIGRDVIGGFEGPEEFSYQLIGAKTENDILTILFEETRYLPGEDGMPSQSNTKISRFKYIFNIVGDDYQFVSVTKVS